MPIQGKKCHHYIEITNTILKGVFKINKKIISISLLFIFVLSIFIPTFAQGNTAVSQEQAMEKVKELFDTNSYDRFNINYNERQSRKTWELDWSQSDEPYSSLHVSIDAQKGNILNLYAYKGYDPDKKPSLVPKLSEDAAIKIAREFATKLQPNEFSQTKHNKREDYRPIEPLRYRESYSFHFIRVNQGIPVENDGFNITVNSDTGDIESYNFNWSYDPLPSADNIISTLEAENVFKEKIGLKLIYKRYFDYRTKEDSIKLVYTVEDPYNVLIDATNGEIIDGKYNDRLMNKESVADGAGSLTPVEQQEIEATKNCITKDSAINIIKKYIEIPKDYTQRYANLYEDYNDPNQKVWNISWEKNKKDEYGSIYARVNALNSELLSFRFYDDSIDQRDFKQKYTRDEAQRIAADFIKQVQPRYFDDTKIQDIAPVEDPEKVREHYFTFTRYINDIPYPANGFNINIDSVSGKIRGYEMYWHDRDFPIADDILSETNAESKFLEDVGLELSFVSIYDPKEDMDKYYLAYKLKPSESFTFDAFGLKPLDSQGKPIEEKHETVFEDIQNHWAKNDIQLLVDLGIIKSAENTFKPDENINQGEFIKLLMIANHRPITEAENIQKYIDSAIKTGWVKPDEVQANSPISREKTVAFVIRSLGYEKIASLHDIFNLTAEDRNSINPNYKGHLAIGIGLDLITEDGDNIKPKANVSNAEAAVILVRMLKIDK